MEKYKIVILIPARNEFKTLNIILNKLIKKNYHILLVDDASNDDTLKIKNKKNLIILRNKKKIGYENTLKKGFEYIKKIKIFSHIITFDADGEHKITDLKKFNKFLNYDLVIGKRDKTNRILEGIISYIFFKKYKLYDPLSGFKMYSLRALYNFNKHLYLTDLTKKIVKNKRLNSINININTQKRRGDPKVGGACKVNLKLIKILNYLVFN